MFAYQQDKVLICREWRDFNNSLQGEDIGTSVIKLRPPIKINKSRPTPRHIVIKFAKYSDKEKIS